jgi:putative FmdB family regulatory protein
MLHPLNKERKIMPIYEYQCTACGHLFEAFQSMKDAPLSQCPECQQSTLNKLVSAASFQLKGTGWYVTDFRDKGKAAPAAAKADAAAPVANNVSDSKEKTATAAESKTKISSTDSSSST